MYSCTRTLSRNFQSKCNKKVLLRERKRHTARHVAIASPCYSRGGGSLCENFFSQSEHVSSQIWYQKFFPLLGGGVVPLQKIIFPSLNMYQAKAGVKNFSLYWGGGPSMEIFFSSLNMYQAKSGVKIFFPLRGGGRGPSAEKFFPQSEHVSSQIWCQKFFPLLRGGVPLWKIFFPV